MQRCWACGHNIRYEPEEGEEDIVVTCPRCLTRHIYIEDEDGNPEVSQAVENDGTVLHRPSEE